jgi:hypothetical protein
MIVLDPANQYIIVTKTSNDAEMLLKGIKAHLDEKKIPNLVVMAETEIVQIFEMKPKKP